MGLFPIGGLCETELHNDLPVSNEPPFPMNRVRLVDQFFMNQMRIREDGAGNVHWLQITVKKNTRQCQKVPKKRFNTELYKKIPETKLRKIHFTVMSFTSILSAPQWGGRTLGHQVCSHLAGDTKWTLKEKRKEIKKTQKIKKKLHAQTRDKSKKKSNQRLKRPFYSICFIIL